MKGVLTGWRLVGWAFALAAVALVAAGLVLDEVAAARHVPGSGSLWLYPCSWRQFRLLPR